MGGGRGAQGQNINRTVVTGALDDDDVAFRPPFPIHCRTIDFTYWDNMITGGENLEIRCSNLYKNPSQSVGMSEESYKICQESFVDYGAAMTAADGKVEMFCDVADMSQESMRVYSKMYLVSRLSTNAIAADHDLYREFQRWVDETNLMLLDQWNSGAYTGAVAEEVSPECIKAMGDYWCTKVFPNCTYMPVARYPYESQREEIYTCREVCETLLDQCPKGWLPYDIVCESDVFKTKQNDADAIVALKAANADAVQRCNDLGGFLPRAV